MTPAPSSFETPSPEEQERMVEAILFAAPEPLTTAQADADALLETARTLVGDADDSQTSLRYWEDERDQAVEDGGTLALVAWQAQHAQAGLVMQGCVVKSGARVENAIVDRANVVPAGTELRGTPEDVLVKEKSHE